MIAVVVGASGLDLKTRTFTGKRKGLSVERKTMMGLFRGIFLFVPRRYIKSPATEVDAVAERMRRERKPSARGSGDY